MKDLLKELGKLSFDFAKIVFAPYHSFIQRWEL